MSDEKLLSLPIASTANPFSCGARRRNRSVRLGLQDPTRSSEAEPPVPQNCCRSPSDPAPQLRRDGGLEKPTKPNWGCPFEKSKAFVFVCHDFRFRAPSRAWSVGSSVSSDPPRMGRAEFRRWPPFDHHRARKPNGDGGAERSEEHTSELQSLTNLVCRLL